MNKRLTALIIVIIVLTSILATSIILRRSEKRMVTLLDGHLESNYNQDGYANAVHPSTTVSDSAYGQAWKVKATGDKYKLTSFVVYAKKVGSPTGHLKAFLYNPTGTYGTNAKPTGSPLAESESIIIENLPSSYAPLSFNFVGANQYEVLKDMVYCIAVQVVDGNVDINNFIQFKERFEVPCLTHDGNEFTFRNSEWATWSACDCCFLVYGEPVSAPPPEYATLTAQAGANGTISPSAGVYQYLQFTYSDWFTASPNEGYMFDHWEVTFNGTHYHDSSNPWRVLMYYNYTIQPVFTVIPPPPETPLPQLLGVKLGVNLAVLLTDNVSSGGAENFTIYTKVDPNSHIALVGTNHVDFQDYRNDDAYLYMNKGAGYFTDFTHLIDVKRVSSQGGAQGFIWVLSNDVDDVLGLKNMGKTCIGLCVYQNIFYLEEFYESGEYADSHDVSYDTWYYLKIEKVGTSLTLKAYSDSARTNLLFTLSLTLHANHNFQYIFACNTWNSGSGVSGDNDIKNLVLGVVVYSSVKGKTVVLI